MRRRPVILVALVACIVHGGATVHAGGGAGGPKLATEATQLLNHGELVSILAKEAEQLAEMIKQYENMLINTQSIATNGFSSMLPRLLQLVDLVTQVEGAVTASQDAIERYGEHYKMPSALSEYAPRVSQWRVGYHRLVAESLRQAGYTLADFATRQQAISSIVAASQSAVGRMQVMQAAVQVAGITASELQSLHGTIIAFEQAKASWMASQEAKEEAREEAEKKFLRPGGFTVH